MSTYNSIQADHLLIHSIQLLRKLLMTDSLNNQIKHAKSRSKVNYFFLFIQISHTDGSSVLVSIFIYLYFFFLTRQIQGQGDRNN